MILSWFDLSDLHPVSKQTLEIFLNLNLENYKIKILHQLTKPSIVYIFLLALITIYKL